MLSQSKLAQFLSFAKFYGKIQYFSFLFLYRKYKVLQYSVKIHSCQQAL